MRWTVKALGAKLLLTWKLQYPWQGRRSFLPNYPVTFRDKSMSHSLEALEPSLFCYNCCCFQKFSRCFRFRECLALNKEIVLSFTEYSPHSYYNARFKSKTNRSVHLKTLFHKSGAPICIPRRREVTSTTVFHTTPRNLSSKQISWIKN
jgi:hypothetical protein